MKIIKSFLFLVATISIVLLSVGCPQPSQNATTSNQKIDYKIKITNIPYDSENLTVIAITKKDNTEEKQIIGQVTSTAADAYLERTVKLLSTYDQFEIRFLNDTNTIKYYVPVNRNEFYNTNTGVYEVNKFYYYYTFTPSSLSANPLVATSESKIQELELGTQYTLNPSENPYLIWHIGNAIEKRISISKQNFDNFDLYISSTKDDIMLFTASRYTNNYYESTSNNIYIMLRPKAYFNTNETNIQTCSITFTDLSAEINKCLLIDKSILASDGKIYASGLSYQDNSMAKLWCIDPSADYEKQLIKIFDDDIKYICELEEGILYVVYQNSISKIDITTGQFTDYMKNLPFRPEELVSYKNGKGICFGNSINSMSCSKAYLFDLESGDYIEITPIKSFSSGVNFTYFPEKDIFFFNQDGSPLDIYFLKIDNTDITNPKYYSNDSYYHGDYSMKSPTKIFKTSPLQIISGEGEIFSINTDLIETVDPTISSYYDYDEATANWCLYEGTLGRSYDDCYIKGDYIYYLKKDWSTDISSVTKCSLEAPSTPIQQVNYENDKCIKFYFMNNKLYLLSNGANSIYGYGNYPVILREINF